jgi:hypothetical protein
MTVNVRKFPRTLNEAFPGTVEYSCALEIPYRPRRKAWARVIAWSCVFSVITMLLHTIVKQAA